MLQLSEKTHIASFQKEGSIGIQSLIHLDYYYVMAVTFKVGKGQLFAKNKAQSFFLNGLSDLMQQLAATLLRKEKHQKII